MGKYTYHLKTGSRVTHVEPPVSVLKPNQVHVCGLQNRLYLANIEGCGTENQTITSR